MLRKGLNNTQNRLSAAVMYDGGHFEYLLHLLYGWYRLWEMNTSMKKLVNDNGESFLAFYIAF